MPEIVIIAAVAANRVIGRANQLIWNIPEDLAHFKTLTQGQTVLMGRKTWESLPPRFRPLPGRRNIVITRQTDWQTEGAEVAHSLEAAIELCAQAAIAWVIGGADIYRQALPLAQQVVVTEIDADFAGDAFAPELGAEWQIMHKEPVQTSSAGLPYQFVVYRRKNTSQLIKS